MPQQYEPTIAQSANAQRSDSSRYLETGIDDFLSKPTPLDSLKFMLDKWLPSMVDVNRVTTATVDVHVIEDLIGKDPEMINKFLQEFGSSAAIIA